jgi:hypothetical protein
VVTDSTTVTATARMLWYGNTAQIPTALDVVYDNAHARMLSTDTTTLVSNISWYGGCFHYMQVVKTTGTPPVHGKPQAPFL